MLRVQVIAGSPIAGRVMGDPFFRAAVCARLVPKPLHVSVGAQRDGASCPHLPQITTTFINITLTIIQHARAERKGK